MDEFVIIVIAIMASFVRGETGECTFQHNNDCRVYGATCVGSGVVSIPRQIYLLCGSTYYDVDTYSIQTLTLIYTSEFSQISNIQNVRDFSNLLYLTNLKQVKASHNMIETIQSGRGQLSEVENVDLSYNFIKIIPNSCFSLFSQLRTLDLSHNLIKEIDILTFEGILDLETLDISYNRIKEIDHSFARFINVKELFINNNNLTTITEPNFKTMVQLHKLNLSFNQLKEIEDNSFQNLVNIQELDISNNELEKISTYLLQNNSQLHTLYLANNPIQIIEPNAFHGKKVTHLTIDGVCLRGAIGTKTFDGIATDELNLSYRAISSLETEAFSGMKVLTLNLSNNVLTKVSSKSFKSVQRLVDLDMSNNNLSIIDFETNDLKQLENFTVQNNSVSKFSKTTLENFESLKRLDLSHNKMSELEPEMFLKMNKLEYLDISYNLLTNSLTSLSFKGLSSVQNIKLNHNRFTSIENNTFSGLRSLEILNCSHGEITSIGFEAFEDTSTLEVLDLSHNLLREFVINSTNIAQVKELRIDNNALNSFTEELISIEYLNLANNYIIKLQAKAFGLAKHLKVLDLSYNSVIQFEDIFNSVTFLNELIVNNVNKQFNFKSVLNITVVKLDMSYNDIDNVNTIFINKIHGINYLNLKSNKITFIDKFSFQNMPAIISLDLSFNLITFIQPGSFLQVNALESLNLHKNLLSALQFGVLDGLNELKVLNLSSNAIHEFSKNIILKTPMISTIALDDNVIEHIAFEEFASSNSKIKLMTIGGNPISCHVIADIKTSKDLFTITAETLDYHSENVDGIKCITNFNFNRSISIPLNETNMTSSTSFWVLAKAIDSFSESVEKLRSSLEKVEAKNDSKEENIQKYILNALNSIEIHTQTLAQSISLNNNTLFVDKPNILTTISPQSKTKSNVDQENADILQNNINKLNQEKDKILNELHKHFTNLKHEINPMPNVQTKPSDEFGDIKGALYFVAACLTILIVISLAFIVVKMITSVKPSQRNSYLYHSSRQPLDNVIELQDN